MNCSSIGTDPLPVIDKLILLTLCESSQGFGKEKLACWISKYLAFIIG